MFRDLLHISCFLGLSCGWLPLPVLGQILPPDRQVDWSLAGYDGNYPEPDRVWDMREWGATGDGKTDDWPAVQAALDSLAGRRGVLFFPAGEYLLRTALVLPDSVVLRGEGTGLSQLSFDFSGRSGDCIVIGGNTAFPWQAILTGGNKGARQIGVADATGLAPGDYAEIVQENGAWDQYPAVWAAQSVGQIVRISAVAGNEVWLEEALRTDLDTTLYPVIRRIEPRQQVGIECLRIERLDAVAGGYGYNVLFDYAARCWIRGIESAKSIGSHVFAQGSTDITIAGSYFHDAFAYDGGSTRGYGVTLAHHTGQVRVQDNVFRRLRHAMMVKQGANGNVFAYNYSTEVVRAEFPYDLSGDISMHGHYAFANLFEGNVVQNIIIDHFWGPSGPFNTFLRNRAEGYGILLGTLAPDPILSDSQNFLGNELTHQLGFPGYYILTGTGHFTYGNHLGDSITPFAVTHFPDESYYLPGKPRFWDEGPWPPVGIPQPYNQAWIPAQRRFYAAQEPALCGDPSPISTGLAAANENSWRVRSAYPNPFQTSLKLEIEAPEAAAGTLTVYGLSGAQVHAQAIHIKRGQNLLELSSGVSWPRGMYFIRLKIAGWETGIAVQKQ